LLVIGLVLLRAAMRSWQKAVVVGRSRPRPVAALDEVWVLGRVTTDEHGERVVGYEHNPDAFTLSTGSRPSVLGAILFGVFVGLIGLAVTAVGGFLFGSALLEWLGLNWSVALDALGTG
jgi:hypothetical protein